MSGVKPDYIKGAALLFCKTNTTLTYKFPLIIHTYLCDRMAVCRK